MNPNLGSIYMYCISIKNIKKCENGLVIAQAKWFLNILIEHVGNIPVKHYLV
jgi:hypothetical protein